MPFSWLIILDSCQYIISNRKSISWPKRKRQSSSCLSCSEKQSCSRRNETIQISRRLERGECYHILWSV